MLIASLAWFVSVFVLAFVLEMDRNHPKYWYLVIMSLLLVVLTILMVVEYA